MVRFLCCWKFLSLWPHISFYENIDAYITKDKFVDPATKEQKIINNYRNFFMFSIMKSMPLFIQPTIYNSGQFNQVQSASGQVIYGTQQAYNTSVAEGISAGFMSPYNVLASLPGITQVTNGHENNFLLMANDTTHEPTLLKEPEYIPVHYVDNTAFDAEHNNRFTLNGQTLKMDTAFQMSHYHINMAALLRIGDWMDHLRELGVYDNTRIILVSDHGRNLGQLENLGFDAEEKDLEYYYPLLMVKDFDSTGFSVSEEFMTNADVPTLAVDGVIETPVNPFTGKIITNEEKTAHDQFVIISSQYLTDINNGTTYLPDLWAKVGKTPWSEGGWEFLDEPVVLTEHKFPN